MAGMTNLPLANGLQPLSCLRCAKRKVRCDRLVPCSNCTRHAAPCDFPQPRAEKRQRKRVASPAISISSSRPSSRCHNSDFQALEVESRPFETPISLSDAPGVRSKIPKGTGCPFSDASRSESEAPESIHQNSNFLFPLSAKPSPMDALKLSRQHLAPLWRIYRSNLHPITMILHTQTASQLLTKAANPQHYPSPETQALLFATMACSLVSVSDEECARLLGQERSALFTTYRSGCEAALVQAKMFTSSSLVVLQAFTIYLVAIAPYTEPCELWNLIGIAKRNARRLNYDRKSPNTGLKPFHYEMHRRLWLNIVMMDEMAAQTARLAQLEPLDDVCLPANVNDADLSEAIQKVPNEQPGATDMLFCLLRFKVSRIMTNVYAGKKPWILATGNVVVDQTLCDERTQDLVQIEKELELQFLRYCDMLNPVHVLAALLARWTICQLRFTSMRLDQYDTGLPGCPKQKNQLMFSTALKVLEYENSVQRQFSTQVFVWHRIQQTQWQCLTHVLEYLGACTHDDLAEKTWEQIDIFYESNPQLYRSQGPPNPLHQRINKLVVAAWQARDIVLSRQYPNKRSTPEYITNLQGQVSHVTIQHEAQFPTNLRIDRPVSPSAHSLQSPNIHANPSRMSDTALCDRPSESMNRLDWDSLIDADPSASFNPPGENLGDLDFMLDTFDPAS